MGRYTLEQRWQILQSYFQSGCCVAETVRILKRNFGQDNAPTAPAIRKFIKKVRECGMLIDNTTYARVCPIRSTKNIAAVAESMRLNPGISIRHRSQELNISRTTLRRILQKDLKFRELAYKIELTQEIKQNDHPLRYRFSVWALEQLENDNDFARKIIFSDEAHFYIGDYVKKQNCRIWGSENPEVVTEKSLNNERVTVWCGLWSGGIIGPFFFEDKNGHNVSVDEGMYNDMITNFFLQGISGFDFGELWFQQDGATCHTSSSTIDLLRTKFNNRIISRFGDVNWPPRSCDLTPMDYFLWGAVKDRCYANKPVTIQELKLNIVRAIAEIQVETIENVLKNWVQRMNYCKASRGSHLEDIVFHN